MDVSNGKLILNKLSMQNSFNGITQLEAKNSVWKRVKAGLPFGQLSFLLRASSDTLPTVLNLQDGRLEWTPSAPYATVILPLFTTSFPTVSADCFATREVHIIPGDMTVMSYIQVLVDDFRKYLYFATGKITGRSMH